MTIDYSTYLTDEQKRNILQQRIAQFAAEAYQHEINKQVAVATNNEDGSAAADNALEILGKALEVHEEELAKLPATE